MELLSGRGAVRKIKVDERLVRDAGDIRLPFEILDGIGVKVDRDLLLQLLCVRILAGVGKIVFSLRGITPCNADFISGAG